MKKKLATVMAATMAVSGSVVSVSAATTNEQLVGADRADTAVKISKDGWKSAETVILVNDSAIPDALTATPLAYAKNAPILLTAKGGLTKATANEIKRLGAKDVIMIGGDAVLPAKIENDLKALKVKTDRVKGSSREETALAIAKRLDGIKDVSEIAVVNGTTGLADAVSVAAAAAEKGMPILLANPKSGLSAVEKFINSESIKSSFVIGGDEAVSDEAIAKLPGKQRIEGSDRNDTNAKVIEKFYADKELDNLYLAKDGMENSGQLIDALAVGALAAKNGAPVLIASKKLNANQVNVVNTKKIATITQVGGKGNEGAFNQLKEIEKAEVIKVKNEAELQEALKKANANDTIEIDANATISKDVTLSTNNAIEINVKGDLTGKVTVKTPNADIKNSGTIGTLVVENGKNTTVTNTSAGKIDKVEVSSSSENVKVENNGTITEVKNDGEGTKVDNEGTISKPITGTETPNVEGNKPGGSTSSGGGSSTPSVDQDKVNLVNTVKAAKDYKYEKPNIPDSDKAYKYTGEIRVIGTESADIEFAGPYKSINLGDEAPKDNPKQDPKKAAMDDMARYLGALYRIDKGETIKAIKYGDSEYKWSKDKKGKELKGSNWRKDGKPEGQTLVNKIVEDFRGKTPTNKVGKPIPLKVVGKNGKEVSVRMNFKQEFPVEANGVGYATLQEAINANAEVKLLKDVNVSEEIKLNTSRKTVIDLNNKTLTSTITGDTKTFEKIINGKNLVLENGTINANATRPEQSRIFVSKGGSVKLDKVNLETTGTGILAIGDTASVEVINGSVIKADGYCFGTNAATEDNYDPKFVLKDSTFISTETRNVGTAVLINVPSEVTMEGCTVNGYCHGVIIRGGTATIKDTTITNEVKFKTDEKYLNGAWEDGNKIPNAALVLGNRENKSYNYITDVTLEGCKIIEKNTEYPAIYMWGNSDSGKGVKLTYKTGNTVTGKVKKGLNVEIDGNLQSDDISK